MKTKSCKALTSLVRNQKERQKNVFQREVRLLCELRKGQHIFLLPRVHPNYELW